MTDSDETTEAEQTAKPEETKPEAALAAERPKPAQDLGPPREERRTRALITLGVGLTLAGIALSVNDDDFARWLVLAGVVIAFVALHRYGRLGPQIV